MKLVLYVSPDNRKNVRALTGVVINRKTVPNFRAMECVTMIQFELNDMVDTADETQWKLDVDRIITERLTRLNTKYVPLEIEYNPCGYFEPGQREFIQAEIEQDDQNEFPNDFGVLAVALVDNYMMVGPNNPIIHEGGKSIVFWQWFDSGVYDECLNSGYVSRPVGSFVDAGVETGNGIVVMKQSDIV